MAKYRTAIIACGVIGRVHTRGWLGVPGRPVEIGALADTNPDALREFGDFFGVGEEHRYSDYREMLDEERPDFVDVCSWHQQHAEMVIAAAARRPKAILCQKPMAGDLGAADRMLMACRRNSVKLVIAFQRPHHAVWLKARDLIAEGVIGEIRRIELECGGNILNTNSHNIRLGLFLMGDPQVEWVVGTTERTADTYERGLPAEDSTLGIAGCSKGRRCSSRAAISPAPVSARVAACWARKGSWSSPPAAGRTATSLPTRGCTRRKARRRATTPSSVPPATSMPRPPGGRRSRRRFTTPGRTSAKRRSTGSRAASTTRSAAATTAAPSRR